MTNSDYLDNYSPFTNDENGELPEPLPQINIDKPVASSSISPASHTTSSQNNQLSDDYLRELQESVNVLERTVANQESEAMQNRQFTSTGEPKPNWPKFYPLIHFDMDEVPENNRGFVQEAFFCWFVMLGAFLLNWIGTMSLLSVNDAIESPGSKIALSSLYFFIIVPLALDLDTLSVYRSMLSAVSTFTFVKIFISLGATCFFEFMLTLGMESSGSVGLISTIELFAAKHIGVAVFGLFVTLGLGAACAFHIKLFVKLWKYYKGSEAGGNMETDMKKSMAEYLINTFK
ncbi:hypothetical protein TRFO_22399 [Tritrichomonas foetus]|uniref:Secretory carrier-associated membrane protein n=1 Tax=Tritrichomonas foetus TaxID=1144522 RepID=A0A1J4KCG7_9EUKA|nr:hypothetical protein TRFO_22399 [Tritrichomonas foetus]|eukprot:OHT08907.1 hypothetical protein TRFO_22399 [Tritrichomonas foetus]